MLPQMLRYPLPSPATESCGVCKLRIMNPYDGGVLSTEWVPTTAPTHYLGQIIDHVTLLQLRTLAVLRRGGLGDVLLTQGALRQLKDTYPHLDITFYTAEPYVPLMRGLQPEIQCRDAAELSQHETEHDALVDLSHYVERSALRTHYDRASLFALAFGLTLRDGRPWVELKAEERAAAQEWLKAHTDRPSVAFAPLTSDPRRSWKTEASVELTQRIQEAGFSVLFCHPAHTWLGEEVVRAGATQVRDVPLQVLGAILAECRAVVSADTGIYHLAAAARSGVTPYLVLVWGMWDHRLRTRWLTNYCVVRSEAACFPCNEVSGSRSICTQKCMDISAEKVWTEALAPALGLRCAPCA